jgi:hypothetical protein
MTISTVKNATRAFIGTVTRRPGGSWPLLFVALAVALVPAPVCAQTTPAPVIDRSAVSPYKVAVGAGISLGYAGWGQPPAGIGEIGGRVQVFPSLGVGASYIRLSAGNNEGYDPFVFHALELNAHWHPIVGRWFDPFLRVGGLAVVDSGGGYMKQETTSRWGLEGMAGFDAVYLRAAFGVHLRYGFTDQFWALAGLHIELRI